MGNVDNSTLSSGKEGKRWCTVKSCKIWIRDPEIERVQRIMNAYESSVPCLRSLGLGVVSLSDEVCPRDDIKHALAARCVELLCG